MEQRTRIIIMGVVLFCLFSQAAFSLRFEGRVYEGNVGDESTPIPNITVTLYGSQDANYLGSEITRTKTNSSGWYGLEIRAGYEYYNIVETDSSIYYSIDATSVDGKKINANQIQYSIAEKPLENQTLSGNKFWDKKTASSSIGDWIWNDVNHDGIQSSGEPGIAGVQVDLLDSSKHVIAITTTDASGYYKFTSLLPDFYYVDFHLPGGYTFTNRDIGTDDTKDSDANPSTGESHGIYVALNQFDSSIDAGLIQEEAEQLDYGDAPDPTFPTLLVNNGARHVIVDGVRLGNSIDSDPDGQQTASARGDDDDGNDDEDGIVFQNDLVPGSYTSFVATVSVKGNLGVWVDFNGNGNWNDPGESIFDHDTLVYAGANTWGFAVPQNAKPGFIIARFRFSTSAGQEYDGLQPDGEVEDYQLEIKEEAGGGSITIIKMAIPSDNTPFNFSSDLGQFSLKCPSDTVKTFTGLNPGTYIFKELMPGGWMLEDLKVSDPNGGSSVDIPNLTAEVGIDSDEHVIVIYTNRKEGTEELDFGDVPDPTFPTLLAHNGARHAVKPGFYLGGGIDSEQDGQPTPLADGDNTNGVNDEDGVTMSPFIAPGQSVPITVVASDSGVINAWIDFNINGNWTDAGEHFIAAMPVHPGGNSFTLNVPAWANMGLTFARFRLSSVRQLSFDGYAPDGEVEDYAVQIVEGDDGSVTIVKEATPEDDTPFLFCQHLTGGFFNILCGNLQDPSNEKLIVLNPYNLKKIVETVAAGWTLTAIDITGDADSGSSIDLANGSVEIDYDSGENIVITFKNKKGTGDDQYDFGDAPDPSYPTVLASNGARHLISPNLFLGNHVDAEPNGQPSPMATGDDQGLMYPGVPFPAGDEDGVLLPPIVSAGQTVSISVLASAAGVLNAWLDFNCNGSWADANEHIIAAQPVNSGTNPFTITIPGSAQAGQSYARFRLSSVRSISFDGLAPDGEVEDYAVAIVQGDGGNITIIKDASPKDNTPFWISVVYGANGGAAPLRDPLSNTAILTNGPVGTYHVGESVPAGWNLVDIAVTGDSDHGSAIDVANAKVDIDLDAGENITVVFKNKKEGEEELFDLGDAPDGTNHSGLPMDAYPGVQGKFPTVFDPATGLPPGPRHTSPKADAWLGPDVSLENDADLMPDMDGLTNIDPPNNAADFDHHDDGVRFPIALPHCQETYFTYSITIPPGSARNDRFVNVWLDWNRDGDWKDEFQCEANKVAPEWAVQNQLIPGGFSSGTYVFATPLFRAFNPENVSDKPIWMRISIAEQDAPMPADGRGPANGYMYGETEDYVFFSEDTTGGRLYDFGDAPDDADAPGYPTLHANSGAYHDVVDGFHLGALIDADADGQPTLDAMGDDGDGMDDEDGVTFSTMLITGQAATVEVSASANGILNAWFDFNANKNWMDANEHVFIDVALNAGNKVLTFNVPATAVPGATFARFRFSRVQGILSTGYGLAGEVEDYLVEIIKEGEAPPLKWMQIPLLTENPDMPYTPCFWGWDVRSVYGGTFVADDWFCKSPRPVTEIHWWGSYTEWDSAFAPTNAPFAFHIGVWTDVPKGVDTEWSHPGQMKWEWIVPREMSNEHVVGRDFHPEYMSKPDTCFQYDFAIPKTDWFYQESDSCIYWLSIAALYDEEPDSFLWGWKTREHFFHDDAVYVYEPEKPVIGDIAGKTEPVAEGWDMAFVLGTDEYFMEFDFGDAPMERYPTLFGQNGALHIFNPNVYLGERIDTEHDGQPDHTCTGDDNDGSNDDDGVIFSVPAGYENAINVEIRASCRGFLNAWMDFNNNGSWADPDEQVFIDQQLPAGDSMFKVPLPDDAGPAPIFSRFRFSTEPGLMVVGIAIDGEVEDYYITLIIDDAGAGDIAKPIPKSYALYQNYPNPFNSTTELSYDLPKDSHVKLSIYNLTGAEIRALLNDRQPAGQYRMCWDGRDSAGNLVPTGVYLFNMQAGEFTATRKIVLLK
ncbi:T9SS type A sorting domain-containing protein [candidate division KSB1 bacterium]|nr:T9SS type A sorting domain-containing protein [candidate division KSB1 bacterium]